MAGLLARAGLVILAVSLCILLVGLVGWVDPERVGGVARMGLAGGLICLALGLVLGILGKAGLALRRRRCARCRRPVRKGAIYCPDHLKEALMEAQEKIHGERGSGV